MDDLISRQAAIDIVNKYKKSHMILWGKPMVGAASIVIELEELPPVQPELPDICVGDIISRQAAIDAVHEEFDDCLVWDESGKRTADEFEIIINRLPSVQSEQTKMIKEIRKWINSGNRGSADYFIVDKIEEIINKYDE